MDEKDFEERLKSVGRNDQCPCGSGKKYKKCHLLKDDAALHEQAKKMQEAISADEDEDIAPEETGSGVTHFEGREKRKLNLKKNVARSNAPRRQAGM